MKNDYYLIKDKCRKGFLKHLAKAFSFIPEQDSPEIIDIGCGTGVPTIWMAENLGGKITAVDTDKNAIEWLQRKILASHLDDRITPLNVSFYDFKTDTHHFDLILAEGFLNVIGFENSFTRIAGMLKSKGYLIIHDEYRDHVKKCDFIFKNGCKIIDILFLDEKVWWNDYYSQLENEINAIRIRETRDLFKSDLKEIEYYKSDPKQFKSIYYIAIKI